MHLFISQGNHPHVSATKCSHYQAGYKNKNEKQFLFRNQPDDGYIF
jgi:hypothetical protein